jgi:hypothetical protein
VCAKRVYVWFSLLLGRSSLGHGDLYGLIPSDLRMLTTRAASSFPSYLLHISSWAARALSSVLLDELSVRPLCGGGGGAVTAIIKLVSVRRPLERIRLRFSFPTTRRDDERLDLLTTLPPLLLLKLRLLQCSKCSPMRVSCLRLVCPNSPSATRVPLCVRLRDDDRALRGRERRLPASQGLRRAALYGTKSVNSSSARLLSNDRSGDEGSPSESSTQESDDVGDGGGRVSTYSSDCADLTVEPDMQLLSSGWLCQLCQLAVRPIWPLTVSLTRPVLASALWALCGRPPRPPLPTTIRA